MIVDALVILRFRFVPSHVRMGIQLRGNVANQILHEHRIFIGAFGDGLFVLAQACGILAPDLPDPVAALRERLESQKKQATDIKALFASREQLAEARLEPGMTFEEIARRTQAIALGLWPDQPR